MLNDLLDEKRNFGKGPPIPWTSTCEPITPEQEERLYYDWRARSDIKCENSWFRIRAGKIIKRVNLCLEERRGKLRDLLDRERTETLRACEGKLHATEICRKEAIIQEASSIKELIKKQNKEVAQRELKRQFKLSCDEYRDCRNKLHRLEIAKDQKFINQFNGNRQAYEAERRRLVERQGAEFTLKITEEDAIRSQKRPDEAREIQNVILDQISERGAEKQTIAAEKVREQAYYRQQREHEMDRARKDTEKALEARLKLHENIERQIFETNTKTKDRKTKDSELDVFLSAGWKPEKNQDHRRDRNGVLNREAKYFLTHQQHIRNHRKCMEDALTRKCAESEEKCLREFRERDAARRRFLQHLNEETFAAHKAGAEDKIIRQAAAKKHDDMETLKMLEEMQIGVEIREADLKAKDVQRQAINTSFMHQLEDRRRRRAETVGKLEVERTGYWRAEKEYLARIHEVVDGEQVLNQVRLHPWRRKHLGMPMDEELI